MPDTLAAEIRSALVAAGVSQYQFAVFAGVNPQTVSRYMRGATWSAETEKKLERALARLPRRKRARDHARAGV
jgi:transcriptional regulator with XRE-family HTH domain